MYDDRKTTNMFLKILVGLAVLLSLCAFCSSTIPLMYSQFVSMGVPESVGNSQSMDLEQRVAALERDQNSQLRTIAWALDQKLYYITGAAFIISGLAGILGWSSYKELEKQIRDKIRSTFDNELYQLDPANLKIWLVSYDKQIKVKGEKEGEWLDGNVNEEMKRVFLRMKLSGYKKIEQLDAPDKNCYEGVTIIPIFDGNMEGKFREFLENNKSSLSAEKAAFILYTRDFRVSQRDTLDKYTNLVTANMPSTAASMILTVGRGLSNRKPTENKEAA